MPGIRVTPEQLASMSGRVSSGAAHIEGELSSLAGSLAPLGGDWAGLAQQRFELLWAEWQRSARGPARCAQRDQHIARQARTHYAEAEQAIAGSFTAM